MVNDIPSIFCSTAEKFKDRIAFNYFDGSWKALTYADFLGLSLRFRAGLLELELVRGERAAIVSENRPEWCASYMAILMSGGIAVPVDMQLGSGEIRNLLMDSETKMVFYSSKTESAVMEAIRGSDVKGVNFDSPIPTSGDSPDSTTPFNSPFVKGDQGGCAVVHPDDIASIIYTSGTTGNPKGVMLTHANFCSDAGEVIKVGVVNQDDNVLSVLPLHHTYPFMCTFLTPVFLGATITFSPGLKPAELISAIEDKDVTIVVGVPRLFEMIRNGMLSKLRGKKYASALLIGMVRLCSILRRTFDINPGKLIFSSAHAKFGRLRFFASGGARLDPEVMKNLEAIGFTVVEGYGLTETSPVITFNPVKRRKPGSAGKPFPSVGLKIAEDGEVMARGPMVMKGYYKNQQATEEAIKDGWLLTGDTGYIDADGYLFITGRKKEVIVLSSGKNIYPEDVEKAYMVTPLIKELCVTGIDRNGVVDYIQAVIVPDFDYARKAGTGNIGEALNWEINIVSAKLPEYMRLKGFTLYPDPLPRTPLGKLRRFMVPGILKDVTQPGVMNKETDRELMADEVGKRVAGCLNVLMNEDIPVRASDNLELDLGFDSLKKIELISSLEETFSITLPETFIAEAQTVGDIVAKLKGHRGESKTDVETEKKEKVSWKEILEKGPSAGDIEKVGYANSLPEKALVYSMLIFLKALFKIFFRIEVKGGGNIPEEGPFVITPNHTSYLDAFVIAVSVPFSAFRRLYFMGLQQFFTGAVRSRLARLSHVIPIDSETYLNKALQMSAYVLKGRRALCIFPEGGRSFDGKPMPFKKGIGVLMKELEIPVVPASIKGAFEALPRGAGIIRPKKIIVTFGKPVSLSDMDISSKPDGGDEYQFIADSLREKVVEL